MRIKADTGAKTGAIDVASFEELPGERVRFTLRTRRPKGETQVDDASEGRTIEAPLARRGRVRSAFGRTHDRLFVETTLTLGGVTKTIELGLVCRKNMISRVLLGRKALEGDFLVDSGRRYLLGGPRRGKRRAKKTATPEAT